MKKYLIHSGDNYLLTHTGKSVGYKGRAYRWCSREKAENVIRTIMGAKSKNIAVDKMTFEIEEIDVEDPVEAVQEVKSISNVKVTDNPVDKFILKTDFGDEFCKKMNTNIVNTDIGVRNILQTIKDYSVKFEARRVELLDMLSKVDSYQSDILHAVELNPKANVVDGYRYYKLLYDMRQVRRQIKDELDMIYKTARFFNSEEIQLVEKGLDGMSNRKYGPRVNSELFGG